MRSVTHARDTGGRAETAGRAGVIREYPKLTEHYPRPDGISSPLIQVDSTGGPFRL